LALAVPAADLLKEPNPFYRGNGFAVMAAGVALLLWPLAAWKWPWAAGLASERRAQKSST
jgi:hypothetical protein